MKLGRTNTILYCQKWAETVTFYRDVFGFAVNHQTDWFVELVIASQTYLSLADERRATVKSVGGQGITLSWQVDDVRALHGAFEQQGIAVSPIREKWGAWLFYIHDPEGHRIELWQPLP